VVYPQYLRVVSDVEASWFLVNDNTSKQETIFGKFVRTHLISTSVNESAALRRWGKWI